MIVFNYLINLIEGLILSSFIANYFDLRNKKKYITIVSLICFLQISISNYFNDFDQFLLYILMITLLVSLWIVKKEKNLEDIIICFAAGMMLLVGNLVSLSCTSLIFGYDIGTIYDKTPLLIFAIVLSKLIFSFIAVITCMFKVRVSAKLPLQNWWMISVLSLSIVFVLAILTEILLVDVVTTNMAIVLIISIIVISILFLLVFRKIQLENQEKMKYTIEVQKNKFNIENYHKIKVMSNQIVDAEHRMMYVLMQIKNCISHMDYENAELITNQYIKKVKRFDTVITTDNPYFDFVISRKINEYIFEDIYVKSTIFIFENDIFNNKYFCDLILLSLDSFKVNLNNKNELSLDIKQETKFVIVEIIGKLAIQDFKISDNVFELIDKLNADYSLKNIKNIFTLKLIVEI